MQTSSTSDFDPAVELGHPDFFAELAHPDGIDDVSLADVFRAPPAFIAQDIPDIIDAEKKLKEAKAALEQIEKTYNDSDCHDVLQNKATLETIGSVSAWTMIFMPLIPPTKEGIALAILIAGVGKVAADTANEMGKAQAYQRCEKCNQDIAPAQNKVQAAQERYETEVKKVFGVYSQSVRRKQATETRIRDWKSYTYKLEVYRHQLDPSKPKPTAPLYAFRATPVATERVMRLGANMFQQMMKAKGL